MAPVRTKKGEPDTNNLLSSPVAGPVRTPERSPIKKSMMILQGQKQALIDNLQLEVTERARKLRAQYALQAQSLRTRVELRVNRIPTALKIANISELLEKYMETQRKDQEPKPAMKPATKSNPTKTLPKLPTTSEEQSTAPIHATRTRGTKRKSDVLNPTDKENTDPIPNPKKRTKTTTVPSRQVTNPSSVLSPKSSNSRTLPHSPFRSPQKPTSARSISPLKPSIPLQPTSTSPTKAAALAATATSNLAILGEKLKPTRAPARKASKPVPEPKTTITRSKKGAATANAAVSAVIQASRTVSSASNASGTSTGTTVVKKAGRPPAAAKKTVAVSAAGKKVTAAKVETAAPAAGRRVLRKRA